MAASTEEKELAELRQLLGDDELNRLRPTGAATKAYAAYTPARRAATAPVSKGGGAGGTKQQAAFEDEGASCGADGVCVAQAEFAVEIGPASNIKLCCRAAAGGVRS